MRRLVMVLMTTVCALTLTACENGIGDPNVSQGRQVYCAVRADEPERAGNPPAGITVRTRFRCDSPGADTLTLVVRLEKQNGSQWVPLQSKTFTLHGEETHARVFKYHSREFTHGCSAGRFRTLVDWTKQDKGQPARGTVRGLPSTDPCRPPLFG